MAQYKVGVVMRQGTVDTIIVDAETEQHAKIHASHLYGAENVRWVDRVDNIRPAKFMDFQDTPQMGKSVNSSQRHNISQVDSNGAGMLVMTVVALFIAFSIVMSIFGAIIDFFKNIF